MYASIKRETLTADVRGSQRIKERDKSMLVSWVHSWVHCTRVQILYLLVDNKLLPCITTINCTACFFYNQFGKWWDAVPLGSEIQRKLLGSKKNVIWKNNIKFHPRFPRNDTMRHVGLIHCPYQLKQTVFYLAEITDGENNCWQHSEGPPPNPHCMHFNIIQVHKY